MNTKRITADKLLVRAMDSNLEEALAWLDEYQPGRGPAYFREADLVFFENGRPRQKCWKCGRVHDCQTRCECGLDVSATVQVGKPASLHDNGRWLCAVLDADPDGDWFCGVLFEPYWTAQGSLNGQQRRMKIAHARSFLTVPFACMKGKNSFFLNPSTHKQMVRNERGRMAKALERSFLICTETADDLLQPFHASTHIAANFRDIVRSMTQKTPVR